MILCGLQAEMLADIGFYIMAAFRYNAKVAPIKNGKLRPWGVCGKGLVLLSGTSTPTC